MKNVDAILEFTSVNSRVLFSTRLMISSNVNSRTAFTSPSDM